MAVHFKNASSFKFWQAWLFYSSLLFALLALIYALWPELRIFDVYNRPINQVLWNTSQTPRDAMLFKKFIYGPLGGTVACSYILLAYIAWSPFKRRERWSRNAIILAFGLWAIVDSYACYKAGVYFQVFIINAISVLQKLLPIVFTWKAFQEESK